MAIEQALRRTDDRQAVANTSETRLPGSDQLEDADIASAIADVLSTHDLPEDAVWARVVAGHVRLEGEVERWSQRDAIERAVSRVKGVQGLNNMLTVRPQAISQEVDWAIVEARGSPW
jgi:osmotically-inducible protein OsmY